jgi:hypothetical protein
MGILGLKDNPHAAVPEQLQHAVVLQPAHLSWLAGR